jgi:NADH-quinone oxidoreductase subunit A
MGHGEQFAVIFPKIRFRRIHATYRGMNAKYRRQRKHPTAKTLITGRRRCALNTPEVSNPSIWPLAAFFILTVLLVTFMLVVSFVLGQRHQSCSSDEPYECGIVSTGSAAVSFGVKFYLMAMFFVIFDLEAVFIFAWAVAARELGWIGYLEILVFVAILIAALYYLWRVGALDWGTPRQQKMQSKL